MVNCDRQRNSNGKTQVKSRQHATLSSKLTAGGCVAIIELPVLIGLYMLPVASLKRSGVDRGELPLP